LAGQAFTCRDPQHGFEIVSSSLLLVRALPSAQRVHPTALLPRLRYRAHRRAERPALARGAGFAGGVHLRPPPYWGWTHLIVAGYGGLVLTALYLLRRDLAANMLAHWLTDAVGFLLG